MLHHHFNELASTQEYLKNEIENNLLEQEILISCEAQTNGKGQYNRKWDSFNETLCFSMSLVQNEVPTLTSLELACLVRKYFFENYNLELALKWPNDILTPHAEKVGGLILNSFKNSMIAGVGLNYFKNHSQKDYKTKYGFLFKNTFSLNKKNEAYSIAMFCNNHRMNPNQVRNYWANHCIHLNKTVLFNDGHDEREGVFIGIGKNGEAIIKNHKQELKAYFSGTVSIRI